MQRMAGEIPSHEDVQEDNGAPVLDKVANQSPSPESFAKSVGKTMEKHHLSKSKTPELFFQPASQILDNGMAMEETMADQSSSLNFDKDVLVVLKGDDSSQSKSLELLSKSSDLSRVASPASFMEDHVLLEGSRLLSFALPCHSDLSISGTCKEEDTPCHVPDFSPQSQHPASICMTQVFEVPLEEDQQVSDHVEPFKVSSLLETSRCREDDDLLSMNDRQGGMSKESELNGPEGLWTDKSALLSNRAEGRLTEELELHPEILEILHLLFSYSSGKPFTYTLSGLYSTLAGIRECGFNVWFEKVTTFNADDELLVIVHWSNMYLFEGGLCLIHGKGLAFQNKKITWQVQKCVLFGKQTIQEIYDIVLKEGQRIVSAAFPETNSSNTVRESHGQQVYTKYSVIRITGDGRCLFRAVAHGLSLRCGKGTPDESQQLQLADDLRRKVGDELVKRRFETEWFIEGDFDVYVNRIRQPYIWGGEPEVLMLTHVLEVPISVYLKDQNTDDEIIAICIYGQEYGIENPIRVLYDGHAHYEALQIK